MTAVRLLRTLMKRKNTFECLKNGKDRLTGITKLTDAVRIRKVED